MSSRLSPLIQTEDIAKIIAKWEEKRRSNKEEMKKPVIIFVGAAGCGKSSCIKTLLNITDSQALKSLNITDHG